MPQLNFNMLAADGPQGVYQGFMQGQQLRNKMIADEQAQQAAVQQQQMNALRMRGVEQDFAAKARAEKANIFKEGLLRAATPEAARTLIKRQYSDPDLGPFLQQSIPLEDALAEISDDPAQFEKFKMQEALGMSGYIKSQEPKVVGNAVYLPGERKFMAAPTQRLVPVIGPNGVPTMVPADQAAGMMPLTPATAKMAGIGAAPARAGEGAAPAEKPLTPAQSAKRRDQLGKEFKAAQNALQTTQDVLDSISFVKNEPGLSRATGFTGTLLPSFPEGAAASAETRLKNLEGKVTALGKAQAAATGAIGSIANQEWKILADQIAAIDRSKGTKPLLDQLDLVELQAQGAMERIRDAYQRQFGEDFERFPQFADLPTPKSSFKPKAPAGGGARNAPAGTGGGLTAAEQAELEQLRARFGKK